MADSETLSAPLVIEYPFSRTVGPVQSAFFTGLREGIVLGVKRLDGTVLVPPTEYDPETSDELSELVEVGQVYGGDEDDRGFLIAGMLVDHSGQLKAVEFGHADVHQDKSDVGF